MISCESGIDSINCFKISDELGSIHELNQELLGYMRKKIYWKSKQILLNKDCDN